jgi:hypothetical protein
MKHEPKNVEFSAAGPTDAPSLPAAGSTTSASTAAGQAPRS